MKFFLCCLLLCLCGVLASCGNGELVRASATTVTLDSDLAKWTGTPCATGSTTSITADDISVAIATVAQDSVNNVPATVVVDSVTLQYIPADSTSPSLAGLYQTQQTMGQQRIVAGATGTLTVRVDQKLKATSTLQNLVCSGNPTIYSYFLSMTFNGHYEPSFESFTSTATANVRFADFADK